MSVSLAALSMAEERSLLPSEGSSRGPRGGGRAIEDGRVEEALVGVHARTRARGSRDEESVMLKLIKLGEICPIVQTRESLFNLPLLSRHQEPARCSRSAGSWRHRHFLFHSTCNAQRREVTLLSVSVRFTGHRLTARARRALLTLVPPPATRCPSRTREWCGRARWAATSAWSASRCPRRSSPRP